MKRSVPGIFKLPMLAAMAMVFAVIVSTPARAEEADEPSVEDQALSSEFVATADSTLRRIDGNTLTARRLEGKLQTTEGPQQALLKARVRNLWASTLDDVTSLARSLADAQEKGKDVSAYMPKVREYISSLPAAIESAAGGAGDAGLPDLSSSAVDLAIQNAEFFAAAEAYDDGSWALKRAMDIARELGIDTSAQEKYLGGRVVNLLESAIVYLDLSISEVKSLRAAAKVLPDDVEVNAKLRIAEQRVEDTAAVIKNNLPILDALELPASYYSQQLVEATGQVSANVLEVSVLSSLIQDWGIGIADTVREEGPALLFQVFLFFLVFFVFLKIAGLARKLVEKAMSSSKVQLSNLLRRMISSVTYNVIVIVGILMALSQVGISLAPILAGLGIAGFILGFALQDSLANFASGMLILLYRPYDVGDMVEVSGVFGKVERMSLVNTTILTLDNQTLIVPNNKIWQDVIKNLTYQRIRRVDMEFGIAYNQDIDVAEQVLREVVESDERVLKDPELNIRVHALGDSSVNFIVRPWVKTDDYWDVFWDITKKVKQSFDAAGISIPFPQRDVHLFAGEPATQSAVSNLTSAQADTKIIDNDAPSEEDDG